HAASFSSSVPKPSSSLFVAPAFMAGLRHGVMSDPAELYYGRRRPRPALQAVVKSSLPGREAIDLGLDKKLKQRRVEQARARLLPDDVERPLDRHGALVGAIGRGQGVENVGDDHHLGLNGKLFALPTARVAG